MGNFTNLALSSGPKVRVVAVEPSQSLNEIFRRSVGQNPGFLDRVTLLRCSVGGLGPKQKEALASPDYSESPWLSDDDLIATAGLARIDFLKCDIEGSEFELLAKGSKILAMTRKIACEVHAFAGDVDAFLERIRSEGFEIGPVECAVDGSVIFLARRLGCA
jgi:FkbM family methyltransferase